MPWGSPSEEDQLTSHPLLDNIFITVGRRRVPVSQVQGRWGTWSDSYPSGGGGPGVQVVSTPLLLKTWAPTPPPPREWTPRQTEVSPEDNREVKVS